MIAQAPTSARLLVLVELSRKCSAMSLADERHELRSSVPSARQQEVVTLLELRAVPVTHHGHPSSDIISFYYECRKIRNDTNASIRQRTYLNNGLQNVFEEPCVVDAKVELSPGSQSKWRRDFESWSDANQQLCAQPEQRAKDLFPHVDRYYDGLGQLSIKYAVRYLRRYFQIGEGMRLTFDTDICVLTIDSANQLEVVAEFPDGILEIKKPASDEQSKAQRAFLDALERMHLPPTNSKRGRARGVFAQGERLWT